MKITDVKYWKEDLKLTRPYTVAYKTIDAVENIFVYIEAENGLYGIGAGSPSDFVTGELIENSLATLDEHLEELLLKKDLRHFQQILRKTSEFFALPAARAAVSIALYDLFSKYLGVPLLDFLGRVHKAMPTSITIGIKSLEESLEEAVDYVKRGFRIIKLKTGRNVEADVEIFAKLREKMGKDIKIRVDANQGYGPDDLLTFEKQTHKLGVEFYEQPLPPGQIDKMRQLPAAIRQLCAADEDLHSPEDAISLTAQPQAYGIFNIKLMKCGGLDQAIKIAGIAQSAGIDLMWGCMDESIISITAALHVALASPATKYLDLDGSFDLARDIASGGFVLKDGCLYPIDKAGLGVELNGDLNI